MSGKDEFREKPVILIVEGSPRGQQWVIHLDNVIIGRGRECQITLSDRSISREHARVWRKDEAYWIEDLGSKNGTHVNGIVLVQSKQLDDGDEIQLALSTKLKFIGSEATVPLSMTVPSMQSNNLMIDVNTHNISVNGVRLSPSLSLHQYRLLELLFLRQGGICTRDEVVKAVWPEVDERGVSEQAVDALVRRLRDRLAEVDPDGQYIATVRGHGFRILQSGVKE